MVRRIETGASGAEGVGGEGAHGYIVDGMNKQKCIFK